MPLNEVDRKFLQTIDRFKVYLLLVAIGVLLALLLAPQQEVQLVTSIIGVALCGVFWLTQRLLSYITVLDVELARVVSALKHTLTDEQRKEFFPSQKSARG
jgi:hypothetical protein